MARVSVIDLLLVLLLWLLLVLMPQPVDLDEGETGSYLIHVGLEVKPVSVSSTDTSMFWGNQLDDDEDERRRKEEEELLLDVVPESGGDPYAMRWHKNVGPGNRLQTERHLSSRSHSSAVG